ncbi:MAG: hypothetical protein IIA59_02160 [Candidatus Marinimicrobia bacterium]|nr:hypothetical protein [Candidatus Neomarinimicrobiota bacterium]
MQCSGTSTRAFPADQIATSRLFGTRNDRNELLTITLQTASIDGEDRQVLVFSWLDEEGKPVHQAVDISD